MLTLPLKLSYQLYAYRTKLSNLLCMYAFFLVIVITMAWARREHEVDLPDSPPDPVEGENLY